MELEVELNMNYAFDAITEAGCELSPLSGAGYQGLQNLGNSCYIASILQLLLSNTIPELSHRYGSVSEGVGSDDPAISAVTGNPLVTRLPPTLAPDDLLTQVTKVGCALTSGVFAKPVALAEAATLPNDPKYRLAPRQFKHVIGKDHVDFRTGQQQDAVQFFQYFMDQLETAERQHYSNNNGDDGSTPIYTTSHLFTFGTTTRMVCQSDQRVKYKENAPETVWSVRIPMDHAVELIDTVSSPEPKRPKTDAANADNNSSTSVNTVDTGASASTTTTSATDGTAATATTVSVSTMEEDGSAKKKPDPIKAIDFMTCVRAWASENVVPDVRWSHLANAVHPAIQYTKFRTFPRYLMIQLQRYELGPDWVPIKLEVHVNIPEQLDLTEYRSAGPLEDENLVPEEEDANSASAPAASNEPEIDEVALSQLMDMGFSINGCKRALVATGGNDVAAATGWIFEHSMEPDFNDPLPQTQQNSENNGNGGVDEGVVQSLVENLGMFNAEQVRVALVECSGSADRAADWLFSNMDDLDSAVAASLKKQAAASSSSTSGAPSTTASLPLDDGEGKYTMIGMVSHIGKNTSSGHYVAHLKKDGHWVIFNDEKVAISSQPPFPHAYLYIFQRNDTIGSPDSRY
jgi:ubiquitin carboxyl-terminal hydrolase 5/13